MTTNDRTRPGVCPSDFDQQFPQRYWEAHSAADGSSALGIPCPRCPIGIVRRFPDRKGMKLYCSSCGVIETPGSTGQQPTQLLAKHQPCGCIVCTCADDVRCHGCGAWHCGTHPVSEIPNAVYEQPAQPGSGEVSRLAFAAGVTLGELHGNESAELQCILRKLIAAQQRIAELERDLENERARGIHTCHDQCQRPLCVAQRRIAELRGCLAELTALVNGESPALLNEDSGGDGELAVRIDNALEDPT